MSLSTNRVATIFSAFKSHPLEKAKEKATEEGNFFKYLTRDYNIKKAKIIFFIESLKNGLDSLKYYNKLDEVALKIQEIKEAIRILNPQLTTDLMLKNSKLFFVAREGKYEIADIQIILSPSFGKNIKIDELFNSFLLYLLMENDSPHLLNFFSKNEDLMTYGLQDLNALKKLAEAIRDNANAFNKTTGELILPDSNTNYTDEQIASYLTEQQFIQISHDLKSPHEGVRNRARSFLCPSRLREAMSELDSTHSFSLSSSHIASFSYNLTSPTTIFSPSCARRDSMDLLSSDSTISIPPSCPTSPANITTKEDHYKNTLNKFFNLIEMEITFDILDKKSCKLNTEIGKKIKLYIIKQYLSIPLKSVQIGGE